MKHDAQYFFDKLSAIPEERWNSGSFQDVDYHTGFETRCVFGLLGVNTTDCRLEGEALEFARLFGEVSDDHLESFKFFRCPGYHLAVSINNNPYGFLGHSHGYDQETPRQRILAALTDIIAKEVPIAT